MFFMTCSILCFTFLNVLVQIQSVTELPDVDGYDIAATELAIRNTVNNIFSTLKLQDMKQKLKLKQYSEIHNFFASITLQDHNTLKEIARISRVDDVDNGTQVFITQLNKVLNEDNKSDETTDEVYITNLIQDFLENLDKLKEIYGLKNSSTNFNINPAIIKHLSNDEYCLDNTTKSKKGYNTNNNNNVLSDGDFSNLNINKDNTKHLSIDDYNSENTTESHKGNDSNTVAWSDSEVWEPIHNQSGRRIYEGVTVKIQRFPFVASVQFFKKFQCGGSIIKSDLVITSASCLQLAWNNRFFRENPAFLSVQVGSHYYQTGGENIPVVEIYFHPNYNPKTLKHNLAITRLYMAISFGQKIKKVKKINYDKNPWALPVTTDGITIIGWGARGPHNNNENPRKNQLSFAVLDHYPLQECQEIYSKEYVTNRNFCAGFFSKGGGACNRDAGGPGIHGGTLMGVVSFGSPLCGAPDSPTVFTKLGYYNDWIEEIVSQRGPTIRQPTTLIPTKIFTFSIHADNQLPITKATFKIEPITEEPEYEPQDNTLEEEQLRKADKNTVFKEFIDTMFDSKELSDYLDQIQAKKGKHDKKLTLKKIVMNKLKDKTKFELDPPQATPKPKLKKILRIKPKHKDKVKTKKKAKRKLKKHSKTIVTTEVYYTALGNLDPYSSDIVTKVETDSSLDSLKISSAETSVKTSTETLESSTETDIEISIETSGEMSIEATTLLHKQNNHEKEITIKPTTKALTPIYKQKIRKSTKKQEPTTSKTLTETATEAAIQFSSEGVTSLYTPKIKKVTFIESSMEAATPLYKQNNREEESTSSDEDKKLEQDILNLIDNLDIEEILESVESSSEDVHKKRIKGSLNKRKSSKSKSDEPLTKVASKIVDKLYLYMTEMKTKKKHDIRERKNKKDDSRNEKNHNEQDEHYSNEESENNDKEIDENNYSNEKSSEHIKTVKSNIKKEKTVSITNQDNEESGTKENDSNYKEESDNETDNNDADGVEDKSKESDNNETENNDADGVEDTSKESDNSEDSVIVRSNDNTDSKENAYTEVEESKEIETNTKDDNKKHDDKTEVSHPGGDDDRRYITLSIPVSLKHAKARNKNDTQKLLQMLYESDDVYELISQALKNKGRN